LTHPTDDCLPVLVSGGGIGGIAASLALVRRGFSRQGARAGADSSARSAPASSSDPTPSPRSMRSASARSPRPRGLHRRDGDARRDRRVLRRPHPTGDAFRERFGNPYAVIHRADVHRSLLEGAQSTNRIDVATSTPVQRVEQDEAGVTVFDAKGGRHRGLALIGADGVKSAVRRQFVGDEARVSGHVVYRAVVDKAEFPVDLQWNAASIWVGPNCHLVHYPLRGGEQYNVVVTFHSRDAEQWSVREGSRAEVQSYFDGICPRARQLIDLPKDWKRWATADRDPIAQWTFGRATLLGDAAHPTLQVPRAGRLHGDGGRGDARRGAARARQRLRPRLRAYQRSRVAAPRASCCRRARWAASSTPRASSAWCATTCGRPLARALLRRDGVAVRLEGRELPRRLSLRPPDLGCRECVPALAPARRRLLSGRGQTSAASDIKCHPTGAAFIGSARR
jgi:salicylate hydroxylase